MGSLSRASVGPWPWLPCPNGWAAGVLKCLGKAGGGAQSAKRPESWRWGIATSIALVLQLNLSMGEKKKKGLCDDDAHGEVIVLVGKQCCVGHLTIPALGNSQQTPLGPMYAYVCPVSTVPNGSRQGGRGFLNHYIIRVPMFFFRPHALLGGAY